MFLSPKKKLVARVKLLVAAPFSWKKIKQMLSNRSNSRYCILVGTPIHGNLGDHLLVLSAKQYIHKVIPDSVIVEITMEHYLLYAAQIKNLLCPQDIVWISGGGWMGTIWPNDELRLQSMFNTFSSYKVIVLPQTAYYDSKSIRYSEFVNGMRHSVLQMKQLYFTFRDEKSYKFALNCLGCNVNNTYLLPDLALTYQIDSKKHQIQDSVLVCLRSDCESVISTEEKKYFWNMLDESQIHYKKITTVKGKVIPVCLRKKIVDSKIEEIGCGKLLITDRLHGMIFAVLAGTPCIAINNASGKVKGVYDLWLSNLDGIMLVNSLREINSKKIAEIIDKPILDITLNLLSEQYTDLTEEIRKWVVK